MVIFVRDCMCSWCNVYHTFLAVLEWCQVPCLLVCAGLFVGAVFITLLGRGVGAGCVRGDVANAMYMFVGECLCS